MGINKAYFNISPWQKNSFFRGKIVSTFAICSNPASPILIVEGSVYTRNILSFIPAEDIDQIKLASTYRGLKHTGGSIRFRSVRFAGAPDLGAVLLKMMQRTSECGTKNDATDFLGYYHFVDIL